MIGPIATAQRSVNMTRPESKIKQTLSQTDRYIIMNLLAGACSNKAGQHWQKMVCK